SARTAYLRLLSGRTPTPAELERWTDVDPSREIALIATAFVDGAEQEIGVARCVVEEEQPARWDFAIVVADAWQDKGLGKMLLGCLIERADGAGVPALSSIVLAENHRMVALAQALGFRVRSEPGGASVLRIERPLPGG
ncbi:MAG: GNAT family N-acetyltransferase, partial [Rhizobacter sp.]|nr:GNAT family N-acetyltransferase [Rhizobacter sp.]